MSATVTTPDVTVPTLITATNLFYFLLVPTLALWYTYWKLSRRHMLELAEKIPGPAGLPIIGNALEFTGTSAGKTSISYFINVKNKND